MVHIFDAWDTFLRVKGHIYGIQGRGHVYEQCSGDNFLRSVLQLSKVASFHWITSLSHNPLLFFLFLVKLITKEMEYKFYNSVQLSTIQNKTKPYSSTGQQTLFYTAQPVKIVALLHVREELHKFTTKLKKKKIYIYIYISLVLENIRRDLHTRLRYAVTTSPSCKIQFKF